MVILPIPKQMTNGQSFWSSMILGLSGKGGLGCSCQSDILVDRDLSAFIL